MNAKNQRASERRRAGIAFLMDGESAGAWGHFTGMNVQALQLRIDALVERGYTEKAAANMAGLVRDRDTLSDTIREALERFEAAPQKVQQDLKGILEDLAGITRSMMSL